MNRTRIAEVLRLVSAQVLIFVVFTGLFDFLTGFTGTDYAAIHTNLKHMRQLGIPPYSIRVGALAVAIFIIMFDPRCARRLFKKPVFRWSVALLIIFTWGMLLRTFNTPVGLTLYDLMLPFYTRLVILAFLISCLIIFDGVSVLRSATQAIALASLLEVGLTVYDVLYPGTFSNTPGRAAGFYTNSNQWGMMLVLSCLIGLPAVPRRWRELFVLATSAAVLATFSRTAMLAALIVLVAIISTRTVSPVRLTIGAALGITLYLGFNLSFALKENGVLTQNTLYRLTGGIQDSSARDRLRLAEKTLEEFEEAPLLGQGLATTEYWSDIRTHDLYLELMADYGVVGILIIPALMLSIGRRSWDFYAFAFAFMLWCLFDHFVLNIPGALIAVAIEASESGQERLIGPRPTAEPAFAHDLIWQ